MSEKQVIIMDSSQISAAFECIQKWDYLYRRAITPLPLGATLGKKPVPKQSLLMGTYGHKLLEAYDYFLVNQLGLIYEAADFVNSDVYLDSKYNLVTPEYLEEMQYLDPAIKRQVDRRIGEYILANSRNYYRPEAVECGFSEVIYEDSACLYILEGRIDVLATVNKEKVWIDHKFQEKAKSLYKKRVQFRNYSLITKRPGIINYIRLTQGTSATTFQREPTYFSEDEHARWLTQLIGLYSRVGFALKVLENNEKLGVNWQTPTSCEGFYSLCHYISLCEEPNPELVQIKLKRDFVERKKWRPW